MNENSTKPEQFQAEKSYTALCLFALGVLLWSLLNARLGVWSFVPVIFGLVGLAARVRAAPLILIVAVALCLNLPGTLELTYFQLSRLRLSELALSGAVLAYVIGHYRLQGLSVRLFPADPRKGALVPVAGAPAVPPVKRTPDLVPRGEIAWALMSLPAWAGLAQFLWGLTPRDWIDPGQDAQIWRAVSLAWIIGMVVLHAAGFLEYWSRRQMTSQEAAVFLQDCVWHETRREQRRINRWLAWANLRYRRRKERS